MTTPNQIGKGIEALLPPLTPGAPRASEAGFASAMEFVLDGLHQHSKLAKEEEFGVPEITYRDMIGSIFSRPKAGMEDEEDGDEALRF